MIDAPKNIDFSVRFFVFFSRIFSIFSQRFHIHSRAQQKQKRSKVYKQQKIKNIYIYITHLAEIHSIKKKNDKIINSQIKKV